MSNATLVGVHVCAECGARYDRGGACSADGRPLTLTDDPLLGVAIGRYRLARLLGEGGMGRVYLAVQPEIGSRVAVKILAEGCAQNPELLERFFTEARAVNLISHENIVSVIDLATLDDGRPYIVMELIDGRTLGAVVRGGGAPLGGIINAVLEVLSALEAAHAIGIVHRDMKPDNVLLTAEGHAKVLDFGIAKLAPGLSGDSPRTATGALLGTPAYMAPEQISGAEHVDARTDLYAVGVVLFEAVTGRLPFQATTLYDLMRAHLEDAPPSPRTLRPDLPPAFERVILTALAKDPALRFQTASAMSHALQVAGREVPAAQWRPLSARGMPAPDAHAPTLAGDLVTPPPTVKEPRPRNWLAIGLAVAVAVIAIGAVAATRGGDHGVERGANVTKGPNVGPAGPVVPALLRDFDPKHFDAIAYLPTATALAVAKLPDAQLVRFDITGVYPNGHADLTLPAHGDASYLFRSPARSARPAGMPSNVEVTILCYVEVTVTPEGTAEVAVRDVNGSCTQPLRPPPACTLAQVWAMGKLAGAKPDEVAKIGYLSDGWFFDTGAVTESFADRCR